MKKRVKFALVEPSGKAAEAGLQSGDILLYIDGRAPESPQEFSSIISDHEGNTIPLVVLRDKDLTQVQIVAGKLGVTLSVAEVEDMAEAVAEHRKINARNRTDMLISTTGALEGYDIKQYLGVVGAECVAGINIFRDFMAALSDIIGFRSGTMQNAIRNMRATCLDEIVLNASEVGANAIIGLRMDFSEISGQGKGMLFLAATGTAVHVEKIANQASPE